MTRPARSFGRVLLFALVPLLSACEESEIPIEPEGEPRFTNLVINKLDAEPELDDVLQPGSITVDVTAAYQLSQGWEDEEVTAFFIVNSFANDQFVRTEVSEQRPVNSDQGSLSFDETFTLADCGGVDELLIYVDISLASDPEIVAASDAYVVEVEGTSEAAC